MNVVATLGIAVLLSSSVYLAGPTEPDVLSTPNQEFDLQGMGVNVIRVPDDFDQVLPTFSEEDIELVPMLEDIYALAKTVAPETHEFLQATNMTEFYEFDHFLSSVACVEGRVPDCATGYWNLRDVKIAFVVDRTPDNAPESQFTLN